MRFQIVRDVALAKELAKAGLLWWVSAEDGGTWDYIITSTYGGIVVPSHVHDGIVGIRVED